MAKETTGLSYCGQEVRRYDNDRFVIGLFAPAERREALFALYAFNLEVAKTREVVTEPMLGMMRLQWWRDTVAAAYGEGPIPDHGVARPLADAVQAHGLSREHFERLIDTREADLDDEPPGTLAALTAYAEGTAAPLALLSLEVLGVRDGAAAESAREAGREVAVAYALAGLLRAMPFHAHQHRTFLPADRLKAHGVGTGALFDGKRPPGLTTVVCEVAEAARARLEQGRRLRREVPRAAVPALLPAVLADTHLAVLAAEGYDVYAPRVQMPNPFRHARLAWAAMRGRY